MGGRRVLIISTLLVSIHLAPILLREGLGRADVGVVPVAFALEAQHCLVLHDVRLVLTEYLVEFFLGDLLFLAVGGLVSCVSASVAPHTEHRLLEGKQVLTCDGSHCVLVSPIVLICEVCKRLEGQVGITDDSF